MDRSELVFYVRSLRSREIERASRHGLTVWALFIGIIYVVWQLVPQVSELVKNNNYPELFCKNFSNLSIALMAGFVLVNYGSDSRPKRPFDYRIDRNPTIASILHLILFLTLVLAFPLYCSIYSANTVSLDPLQHLQFQVNKWVLIVTGVFAIIDFIFTTGYQWYTGYPSPNSLVMLNHKKLQFIHWVAMMLYLELFFGNLGASVQSLLQQMPGQPMAFVVAMNASLICLGLIALFALVGRTGYLTALDRLERDIMLHNIDAHEITKRLEQDFLGRYFGSWVAEKIELIKTRAQEMQTFALESDALLSDLDKIDVEYKYERMKRIQEYIQKLSHLIKEYFHVEKPFLKWLSYVSTTPHFIRDKFIADIISQSHDELDSTFQEVIPKAESALEKLRQQAHKIR